MSQRLWSQVANYLANQFLVERLANARWFQRFAVRTHFAIRDVKATTAKAAREVQENPEFKQAVSKLQRETVRKAAQANANANANATANAGARAGRQARNNTQQVTGGGESWWDQVAREVRSARSTTRRK